MENSATWGDTTMAPRNMCKQARMIYTNQIQSKTQQPDKILNHRDLRIWLEIWLGWHKTWTNLFIWVHWNSTGRHVVHGENDCWVHVMSVFLFYKSIVKTCYGIKDWVPRGSYLLFWCMVGDPAQGWSGGNCWVIASYGWEELIL